MLGLDTCVTTQDPGPEISRTGVDLGRRQRVWNLGLAWAVSGVSGTQAWPGQSAACLESRPGSHTQGPYWKSSLGRYLTKGHGAILCHQSPRGGEGRDPRCHLPEPSRSGKAHLVAPPVRRLCARCRVRCWLPPSARRIGEPSDLDEG